MWSTPIFVTLYATDLSQLLEDTAFFFVIKVLLELALLVAEALDLAINTRWRHLQQNIRTVDPMDMGLDRVKPAGWNIFKTQELLDILWKSSTAQRSR
jgi:hypothetical protein